MNLLWTAFVLFIFFSLTSLAWAGLSLAVWVPTRREDLDRILKLAELRRGQTLIELGCGTGLVARFIATHSPARVIGLELVLPLYWWSRFSRWRSRLPNLSFRWQDLFKADFSQADVIYVFGVPDTIKNRLKTKLERELKAGSRVISYAFPVEGWQPEQVDKPAASSVTIYRYHR